MARTRGATTSTSDAGEPVRVVSASLVADMRRAQREYFRTRSTGALNEAKRLEAEVDRAVEMALRQRTLFDVY